MASYLVLTALLVIFTGCHGNGAYERGMYLKDAGYMWSDQSVFDSPLSAQNVSEACQQDLMNLFSGDPSVVQVLDSFGKPAPGTLVGNTQWVGHFEECMNVIDFRHCLVDIELNITLGLNNTQLALPISWGVCAPVSCSEGDVQNGLEILLGLHNVSWMEIMNMTGSGVHCTEKPSTNFSGGFIGTCILLSVLSILSVVGTVLDHHITRKQKRRQSSGLSSGQKSTDADKGRGQIGDTVKEDVSKMEKTAVTISDPDSVHACIDDLGSGRRKEEEATKAQMSNEKSDLFLSVRGYGATGQREGILERQAANGEHGEIHITSGSVSETTALLDGSRHPLPSINKPKNGLWMQFLLCFSMSRNLPVILGSKHPSGSIPCLNGIRVISILWVILSHVFSFSLRARMSDNILLEGASYTDDFAAQIFLSTVFSVDSFFLLAGLLMSYLTLKKMNDRNGKVAWGWLYFHRYIRLTPTLAVVILLWMFILPNMIKGPVAYRFDYNVDLCRAWWWTDLLYINNFVPPGLEKDCISWSWYLANDMQFFIISPLFIIPLYRYGVKGMIVILTTCMASFITTGVLVYQNNLHASPVAEGVDMRMIEENTGYTLATNQGGIIYNKPYCRIPPYLVGIALGYAMYEIRNKKIKLSPIIVASGWSIASALGIAVVYGLYDANRGAVTLSQAADIMYITFSRSAWALAVAWVIFACHYGYGGVVNDFLSWNFWVPLGRLTYATYLIHPLVQNLHTYSLAVPTHWSSITVSYLYAAFILLSYCCAMIMCVLVEFPFGNLDKMVQTLVQARHTQRAT